MGNHTLFLCTKKSTALGIDFGSPEELSNLPDEIIEEMARLVNTVEDNDTSGKGIVITCCIHSKFVIIVRKGFQTPVLICSMNKLQDPAPVLICTMNRIWASAPVCCAPGESKLSGLLPSPK